MPLPYTPLPVEKFNPTPMVPVQALVIGTGTGNGGPSKQTIETPAGQPNVVVTYITPVVAILVRFVSDFVTVLIPTVSAGLTTSIIPASDFFDLLWKCASLSVAGAVVGSLKNFGVVLTSLKDRFPLLGAS